MQLKIEKSGTGLQLVSLSSPYLYMYVPEFSHCQQVQSETTDPATRMCRSVAGTVGCPASHANSVARGCIGFISKINTSSGVARKRKEDNNFHISDLISVKRKNKAFLLS